MLNGPIINDRRQMVAFRKGLGISQTELAEMLGMKVRAIQDIENGRTPLRMVHMMALDRIATAYSVQTYTNGIADMDEVPRTVAALDHQHAAEKICGTDGLSNVPNVQGRDLSKLVAKVWTIGPDFKPIIRWFFRNS